MGGPSNGPSCAGMVNQFMADTNSERGVECRMMILPTGAINEPPSPCSARAATSAGSEADKAQASEPMQKIDIAPM